jgi:hypothetical protein
MIKLQKDLREFIELLNSHEVRYLIVGGHAVAFHGYPRMTGDIDFFLEVSEENARKLVAVLAQFGFAGLGLTAKDFLEPGAIIQLGYPPHRIDLVTSISGVTFAQAWEHRVYGQVEGLAMVFVDKPTLLANKAASGRPKDLADLDALSKSSRGKPRRKG